MWNVQFSISAVKLYRGSGWDKYGRRFDASSPRTGTEASLPGNQAMRRGSIDYTERKSATGIVREIL